MFWTAANAGRFGAPVLFWQVVSSLGMGAVLMADGGWTAWWNEDEFRHGHATLPPELFGLLPAIMSHHGRQVL